MSDDDWNYEFPRIDIEQRTRALLLPDSRFYETQKLQSKIADLEDLLLSGETSVTIDGTTTTIDLATVRDMRDELRRRLYPEMKPRIATIDLGGCW